MSAQSSTASAGRRPVWRRQQFWRVALPVIAGVVTLVGVLVIYNAIYGSNGASGQKSFGVTYPAPVKPKTVKLDPSIHGLVNRFVQTAVARKNLDVAYQMVGPEILQGMTMKQWMTGNIAVVPFDVDARTIVRVMSTTYSYQNRAELQVFLGTPGRSVTNSPHTFFVDLIKQNGKWVVNSWVPRWTPPIPTDPGR